MDANKKILPIQTAQETHINFNLSMILSKDMQGWFYMIILLILSIT